jgi:hypothetical protein
MNSDHLVVLWTTDNLFTVEEMILLYTLNAKKQSWFKEVTLINWGAATKLLAENQDLQERMNDFMDVGVNLQSCKHCADKIGGTDTLRELGFDVKYMGEPLSEYLKSGASVITV